MKNNMNLKLRISQLESELESLKSLLANNNEELAYVLDEKIAGRNLIEIEKLPKLTLAEWGVIKLFDSLPTKEGITPTELLKYTDDDIHVLQSVLNRLLAEEILAIK